MTSRVTFQTVQHLLRTKLGGLALFVFCLTLTGCNQFILLSYLLTGPPSIEPDFDATTRKSMTSHGVTVAIVCYAPTEVKWDTAEIDQQIAKHVAFRLHSKKIKTVAPDAVQAWLDEHSDWDEPEEIGRALGVNYVIYIDVERFSLFEENSANLRRGRTEGLVKVFEMNEQGNGDMIYSKEIVSVYPTQIARDATLTSYDGFKREYLSRLSEEIGRLFYEYYNGDDVHAAT